MAALRGHDTVEMGSLNTNSHSEHTHTLAHTLAAEVLALFQLVADRV